MKRIFNVDFRKLATLLTPTFLRKPIVLAILMVLMRPLTTLHALFNKRRNEHLYDLTHNGQVCRLKDALNALFGLSYADGFEIKDLSGEAQYVMVYDEDQDMPWMVNDAEPYAFVYDEALIKTYPNTFLVLVPTRFAIEHDMPVDIRISATVEKYKLLGTKAIYRPKNS